MVYLIGLVVGIVLTVFGIIIDLSPSAEQAIDFTKLGNFFDVASIFIVLGGVGAGMLMSYPLSVFKDVPKHFKILTGKNKFDPNRYIRELKEYAEEARRKGLLALEDKVAECEDTFLKSSIMLIVDAIDPEKVKKILSVELEFITERHSYGASFYDRGAAYGPAFGMIGTLIGLINMLAGGGENLDPASLVSGMGVALITTFYGSILANLIFTPISAKLRGIHQEELLCKLIIIEGVVSIQAGENPRHIEEKLLTMISEHKRNAEAEAQKQQAESEKE